MSASLDQSRSQQLHAAAELADRAGGESTERFLRRYYRHVATEDLLARAPEDLLGAALSHQQARRQPAGRHGQRARLHPDGRGARLVQRPHRHRDRHRRHAVPRRLGHRRAVAAGARRPPGRAPAARRPPRRHRRAESRSCDVDATGQGASSAGTSSRGCTSRSTARADAARRGRSPTALRGCSSDVRDAVEDWPKMRPTCDRIADELAADAAGRRQRRGGRRRPGPAAMAGRRPLHLPRLPRVHPARARTATDVLAPVPGHRARAAALRPAAVRQRSAG